MFNKWQNGLNGALVCWRPFCLRGFIFAAFYFELTRRELGITESS